MLDKMEAAELPMGQPEATPIFAIQLLIVPMILEAGGVHQ
jgi:hypothetical protein